MEEDNICSGSNDGGQHKVDHVQSSDVPSKLNPTYDSQDSDDDDALGDMIYQSSRTRKSRAAAEAAMKGKAEEQELSNVNRSSLKAETEFTANSTTSATSDGIVYNVKVPGIHDGEGEEFFPSGRRVEKSKKIQPPVENNRRSYICETEECTNQARVGGVHGAAKRNYCSHEGRYNNNSMSVDVLTKLLGDVTRSMIEDRKLIEIARGNNYPYLVKLLEESLETGRGLELRLGLQLQLAKRESRVHDTLTQSWDSRTYTSSIQQSHNTSSNNINRLLAPPSFATNCTSLIQQQLPCPTHTQAPIDNKKQVSMKNQILSAGGKSKSTSPSSKKKMSEAQNGKTNKSGSRRNIISSGSDLTFPYNLYNMLEYASSDVQYSPMISWSSSGKSFAIHNREEFVSHVAPIFFPKQSKYRSFTRQLNLYGFSRLNNRGDGVVWAHEFFIRGQTEMLDRIDREEIRLKRNKLNWK